MKGNWCKAKSGRIRAGGYLQIHEYGSNPLTTIFGIESVVKVVIVCLIFFTLLVLQNLQTFTLFCIQEPTCLNVNIEKNENKNSHSREQGLN